MPSNISAKEFSGFIEAIERMLEKEKKHNDFLGSQKTKMAAEFKKTSDQWVLHLSQRLTEYKKYYVLHY